MVNLNMKFRRKEVNLKTVWFPWNKHFSETPFRMTTGTMWPDFEKSQISRPKFGHQIKLVLVVFWILKQPSCALAVRHVGHLHPQIYQSMCEETIKSSSSSLFHVLVSVVVLFLLDFVMIICFLVGMFCLVIVSVVSYYHYDILWLLCVLFVFLFLL